MTVPTQLQPPLRAAPAGAAHSLDTKRRLVYLDGLRGLAILSVFFFHSFARWPELVPYGAAYANLAPFKYGLFGVRLFFMISGFVILMTLDKCTNFGEFMLRRWLRLFPAMLIATIVLFLTAPLFPERPGGMPVLRDLLPGLSLIDPIVWLHLLGGNQGVLEWTFWSLFAEIKFYLLFGSAYFFLGRTRAIWVIFGCFAFSVITELYLAHHGPSHSRLDSVLLHFDDLSSFQYFGWFAAGAWFYEYDRERTPGRLGIALLVALIAALLTETTTEGGVAWVIAGVVTVAVFVLPLFSKLAARVAAARLLVLFGFVSYPFYLLHEKTTIALLIKSGPLLRWLPGWALILVPLSVMFAAAWLVAKFGEPWVRSLVRPPVDYVRAALTKRRQPA